MNNRNSIKIKEKLGQIQSNSFGADDVEILLINIREYARSSGYNLLLEFCDCIAHPDRNKGMIYEELDIFYSKMKYMPTIKGDQIDYDHISKEVFKLLFQKAIDQLSDDYFLTNLGKNRMQIKNHIANNLLEKKVSTYKAKDELAIEELRSIQKVCNNTLPLIRPLTEANLWLEIKSCVSRLSSTIGFEFDEAKFESVKNNLILSFFEIIQDCNIELHDGSKANGFITVGPHNTLYEQRPRLENLNLCFTVKVPIEQSFVIFDLIQTSLTLGHHIPNSSTDIEWLNNENTFGKLKPFKVGKSTMLYSK